jgi:hypothetical protein
MMYPFCSRNTKKNNNKVSEPYHTMSVNSHAECQNHTHDVKITLNPELFGDIAFILVGSF